MSKATEGSLAYMREGSRRSEQTMGVSWGWGARCEQRRRGRAVEDDEWRGMYGRDGEEGRKKQEGMGSEGKARRKGMLNSLGPSHILYSPPSIRI